MELDKQTKRRVGTHSRKPWSNFINRANSHLTSIDALDLLDRLLRCGSVPEDRRIGPTPASPNPNLKPEGLEG